MKKFAIISILVAATLSACQKDPIEDLYNREQYETIGMAVNLSVADMSAGTEEAQSDSQTYPITKSTIASEDELSIEIKNLWVAQFDDNGKVVGTPQYIEDYQTALQDALTDDNDGVPVSLIPSGDGVKHTLVYVANSFNKNLTASLGSSFTIDEFKNVTYEISSEVSNFKTVEGDDTNTKYIVLFGEEVQEVNSSDGLNACELIRNVAQINVTIQNNVTGLEFTKALIKGIPKVSSYCPDYLSDDTDHKFPADNTFSYFSYDSDEIAEDENDEYETLTFYVPVNMRGSVENTTEQMKNHYSTAYCTAISLMATTPDDDTYLYTFYLGSNLTSDFNIRPNTKYNYTLTFDEVGDPATDLRVENYSCVDYSLSTMARSNCYILNPSDLVDREYIIPIDRIDEFWGDSRYCGSTSNGNTLDEIRANWEAVILWTDHNNVTTLNNMITNGNTMNGLKVEKNTDTTVKVTLPTTFANAANHCNVTFVVRKTSDETILWTWHLWITDYNPYRSNITLSSGVYKYSVDGGELHRYNNAYFNSGIYSNKLIMDRNIGARSANEEGYGGYMVAKKAIYTFTPIDASTADKPDVAYYSDYYDYNLYPYYDYDDEQIIDAKILGGYPDTRPTEDSEITALYDVTEVFTDVCLFKGNGTLHYQFGRSVPFPNTTRNVTTLNYYYNNDLEFKTYNIMTEGNSKPKFADFVNYPQNYYIVSSTYVYTTPLYDESDAQSAQYLWNDYKLPKTGYTKGKSIFDPSPWGFRVPITGTWTGFTASSAATEYKSPNNYTFKLTGNDNGVSRIPYTRMYNDLAYYIPTGNRSFSGASLGVVGTNSYYWSATPVSATNGYYISIGSTGVSTAASNFHGYGFSVRAIQE
ncbi:MAG: fimbrial protein [Rikenellaceae bacterium]